ncbi:MAG: hypothetical protein ACOYVD_09005 [Bacillota bacterium]
MNSYIIRTEDFKDEVIKDVFVETAKDRELINNLKSEHQMLLVGSRGVGKTMLLKMAEIELNEEYRTKKYLPVFSSFVKGILVNNTLNSNHFRYWMISKILNAFRSALLGKGVITRGNNPFEMLFKTGTEESNSLDEFIKILEETWNQKLDLNYERVIEILGIEKNNIKFINEIDSIKILIEQFCKEYQIEKVVFLFDEACHNFIPEQQREFFSMIRDLRSPYICCKAAVYPGITYYGTLQKFHDIHIKRVERDITDKHYFISMREIVEKQSSDTVFSKFKEKGQELDALIICSSGNPRLLLKSIEQASKEFKTLKRSDVNDTIIDFYRVQIWDEHTRLSDTYKGHKELIDWSRIFLETSVMPETIKKNTDRKPKQTTYFAVQRDVAEKVKNAIRILEYTGIVQLHTEGTKVRTSVYDRYQINIGVVVASESSKSSVERCRELYSGLSQKIFTDYGANSPVFRPLVDNPAIKDGFEGTNLALEIILQKPIESLDISVKQIKRLKDAGFLTIHEILTNDQDSLMRAQQIGPIRSKSIYSTAYNAAVEYISG